MGGSKISIKLYYERYLDIHVLAKFSMEQRGEYNDKH
jgi:hypothetical protein